MINVPWDVLEEAPNDAGCRAAVMQCILHALYEALDEVAGDLDSPWCGQRGRNLLQVRLDAGQLEQSMYTT